MSIQLDRELPNPPIFPTQARVLKAIFNMLELPNRCPFQWEAFLDACRPLHVTHQNG
jgi:hypothetical protein